MFQLEKMVTLSEQLSELNAFESLILLKNKVIDAINSIIFGISAENSIAVVVFLSILIGIGIKRWKKLNWWEVAIMTALIFGTLRFINIGG